MFALIGIPPQALFGQLLLGLINGSFYAMLSLGLALIFGLLNVVNFAHGAQYMLGAYVAWLGMTYAGINYWLALLLAPLVVGSFGLVMERLLLRRLYELDHLYGLLLTFGLALIIEGLFRQAYGISGQPYSIPVQLSGGKNLGFMFLPNYRAWVVVFSVALCLVTWLIIEKTKLGSYLRAGTENPTLVQAFGINVPRMVTLTYGFGVALAAMAGVLAAPIYQVKPTMGADMVIVVFAVVVIGGMGSIVGSFFGAAFIVILPIFLNQMLPLVGSLFGLEVSIALVSHVEIMVFGALIIFFLIVEPHGLARLWATGREKLRLWPFPH